MGYKSLEGLSTADIPAASKGTWFAVQWSLQPWAPLNSSLLSVLATLLAVSSGHGWVPPALIPTLEAGPVHTAKVRGLTGALGCTPPPMMPAIGRRPGIGVGSGWRRPLLSGAQAAGLRLGLGGYTVSQLTNRTCFL